MDIFSFPTTTVKKGYFSVLTMKIWWGFWRQRFMKVEGKSIALGFSQCHTNSYKCSK